MNRKDEEKYKKLVKNLFKKSEIKKINKRKMENVDVLFVWFVVGIGKTRSFN